MTIAMAETNQKEAKRVAVDPSLLEWAEYWYPIAWKGVLGGGLITAIGACATIAFLLLQWRSTTIREEQSDWRTSVLESDNLKAKAALETARADIIKANARSDEANKKAKEAELALFKLKKPRMPDKQILAEEAAAIPPTPFEILYVRECPDCLWAGTWILAELKELGWTPAGDIMRPIDRKPDIEGAPSYLTISQQWGGQPWGITVIGRDAGDPSKNNGAIAWLLTKALGKAMDGDVSGSLEVDFPAGFVRIIVAPRA